MEEVFCLEVLASCTGDEMGKRVGDASRQRRFCFAENPAKATYYARFRCTRLARRMLGAALLLSQAKGHETVGRVETDKI